MKEEYYPRDVALKLMADDIVQTTISISQSTQGNPAQWDWNNIRKLADDISRRIGDAKYLGLIQ